MNKVYMLLTASYPHATVPVEAMAESITQHLKAYGFTDIFLEPVVKQTEATIE